MASRPVLPAFEALPLNPGDPPYSAWGLWGPGDRLGSLNYLSNNVVLQTMKEEVKTGERVGLELVVLDGTMNLSLITSQLPTRYVRSAVTRKSWAITTSHR